MACKTTPPHLGVCCNAGLSQPQPEPGVCVVDLHHLEEGIEGWEGLPPAELLETQVVEQHVAAVHPQY